MKAIMLSIRPRHAANIISYVKLWEIRKLFPLDYVGWVYLYVTQDSKQGWCMVSFRKSKKHYYQPFSKDACYSPLDEYIGNGKVVARFWCDKVEEIKYHFGYYDMGDWTESYILENACLSAEELDNYLQASKEYDETKVSKVYGKAIHITKLEIFDKPKEISEFTPYCELCGSTSCCNCKHAQRDSELRFICCDKIKPLTRAPQSWCYVEV